MARAQAPSFWETVASFYAGRPIRLNFDPKRSGGANTAQDGTINMAGNFQKRLLDLAAAIKSGNKQKILQQSVIGIDPLAVLIHESIHNRQFSVPDPKNPYFTPYLGDNQQAPTGFYGAGNEPQAMALGAELVPDLLQRFFGIKIGSPMSRRYARNAKSRGEYDAAYLQNGLPRPPHG